MTPTLATILLFVAVPLIVAAILMIARDLRESSAQQRNESTGRANFAIGRLRETPDPGRVQGAIAKLDAWIDSRATESDLGITPLASVLLGLAVGLVIGGCAFLAWGNIPVAAIGVLLGMLLVAGYLSVRRQQRCRVIQEQLPEVIELIARAVRAGESLDQAVDLAGKTAAEPLGTEFRRCSKHMEMGLAVDGAMRALSRRVPVIEARILAVAFMMYRRAGGNLPITLERLAKVIRDRVGYRRQFRAATAAGRISTIIIALAGPLVALYFLIWQGDYIAPYIETTLGTTLLAIAIMLQLLGLFWVFRLLQSDY